MIVIRLPLFRYLTEKLPARKFAIRYTIAHHFTPTYGSMRTAVRSLRRKLGDDPDNPAYIFTEPRVGYRMPKGEGREES